MRREVRSLLEKINRRSLNNTQRVLFRLLSADGEWVSRSAIRVPSVGSRIRDLRKAEFGGFGVRCATATALQRRTRDGKATFYALDTSTVTSARVRQAFRTALEV